jgi:hypothetical protein
VSVIMEGQGLNVTVQSYLDRLDFGLVSCPELVPDVDALLDAILLDIATLADRTRPARAPSAVAGPNGAKTGARRR